MCWCNPNDPRGVCEKCPVVQIEFDPNASTQFQATMAPPPVYRCTKGHNPAPVLTLEGPAGREQVCGACLVDLLRQHCGALVEVTEGGAS